MHWETKNLCGFLYFKNSLYWTQIRNISQVACVSLML